MIDRVIDRVTDSPVYPHASAVAVVLGAEIKRETLKISPVVPVHSQSIGLHSSLLLQQYRLTR